MSDPIVVDKKYAYDLVHLMKTAYHNGIVSIDLQQYYNGAAYICNLRKNSEIYGLEYAGTGYGDNEYDALYEAIQEYQEFYMKKINFNPYETI